jgi:hypothetical protein
MYSIEASSGTCTGTGVPRKYVRAPHRFAFNSCHNGPVADVACEPGVAEKEGQARLLGFAPFVPATFRRCRPVLGEALSEEILEWRFALLC